MHFPSKESKPYLSPSQLSMFLKCGEAYRRRYIQGEKIPPGIAQHRGSAVHKGAEYNYRQKIESRLDLKADEVVDYAVAAFEDRVQIDGLLLDPLEEREGKPKILGAAKDETAKLTDLLMTQVAPKIQPVAVEETHRMALPDSSHDLLGIFDLIDDKNQIRDLKTTSKTKLQMDVDKDSQFTFYSFMYRAKFGVDPAAVVVDNLVLKKVPESITLTTHRSDADYQVLINRINTVLDAINKGVYPPAPEGSWACSPRFCGYWSDCPYVKR